MNEPCATRIPGRPLGLGRPIAFLARTRRLQRTIACAALLVGAVACVSPAGRDTEALRGVNDRLDAIAKRLQDVDQRLSVLIARGGGAGNAAVPVANAGRVVDIDVGDSPILGPSNAPVTLVEFSDFQCPFCAGANPLIKSLVEKYPDEVRVVFKHFPLSIHPAARPAAIASCIAQEQGRFWELHDVLLASHRTLQGSDEALESYARQAGIDVAQWSADRRAKAGECSRRVDADVAQGRSIGVRGTPTLFVNGKRVQDRSLSAMSAMIDAALAQATADAGASQRR
jgi:protein-disulfide isomerase